jgi:hypothetical protein
MLKHNTTAFRDINFVVNAQLHLIIIMADAA